MPPWRTVACKIYRKCCRMKRGSHKVGTCRKAAVGAQNAKSSARFAKSRVGADYWVNRPALKRTFGIHVPAHTFPLHMSKKSGGGVGRASETFPRPPPCSFLFITRSEERPPDIGDAPFPHFPSDAHSATFQFKFHQKGVSSSALSRRL